METYINSTSMQARLRPCPRLWMLSFREGVMRNAWEGKSSVCPSLHRRPLCVLWIANWPVPTSLSYLPCSFHTHSPVWEKETEAANLQLSSLTPHAIPNEGLPQIKSEASVGRKGEELHLSIGYHNSPLSIFAFEFKDNELHWLLQRRVCTWSSFFNQWLCQMVQ